MLYICFGSVIGWTVGNFISIVIIAICEGMDRRRKRKEESTTKTD